MAETALHETGQQRPLGIPLPPRQAAPYGPAARRVAPAARVAPGVPVSPGAPVSPGIPVSPGARVAPGTPVLPAALPAQLAAAWLSVLADGDREASGDGDSPLDDPETSRRILTDLSGRLISILLGSPFQPRKAAAVGRALVTSDFVWADVLGSSLRVLILRLPSLIRATAQFGTAAAGPADLEQRLAAVTEALANGYVRALRERTLAEQESIRQAERDAQRILSEQLRHQATHDPLSGLPNRVAAFSRLSAALAAGPSVGVGLCYLDLDGFKEVNDRHGHSAGDRLLVTVAERISLVARAYGTLAARIGGDEFIVVAEVSPGLAGMIELATSVLTEVSRPVPLPAGLLAVSACAGITDHAASGITAEALVAAADTALYQAKSRGPGHWAVYH